MTVALQASAFDQFARAQPAAALALRTAIATDAVAHAWLLLGPAGGGQQEAARYLGAALNCTAPGASDGVPCADCASCRKVLRGTHTAVVDFEPEGAYHRVKDVRDEWIPMATRTSLDSRWKVLRIAAADRMNEAAQNAFLKILEEPPASVIWILDVADDAALLDTIVSRCRRLDVTPWSQDLLRERLDSWIAAGEGDPGIGSGAEVVLPPPDGRPSKKTVAEVEHLAQPSPAECTAMVRLAKGSPALLESLATCDGRRIRTAAMTTVDEIIDLGPRAAGGVAPQIVNRVLEGVGEAQARIEVKAQEELLDLGESLGVTMEVKAPPAWPGPKRGEKLPSGVEGSIKERTKREQRDAATAACRLYLDLLGSYLQDVLAAWQRDGEVDEAAIRNVDRMASVKRAATRMDPVGIVEALAAIETAHLAFDLNGDRKLQLERAVVRVVLACAKG